MVVVVERSRENCLIWVTEAFFFTVTASQVARISLRKMLSRKGWGGLARGLVVVPPL